MKTNDLFMSFGKYKNEKIINIDSGYLVNLYKSAKDSFLYHENGLLIIDYIEKTFGLLKIKENVELLCDKITYPSQKEAKYELNRIRNTNQTHKKPIRTYQCDICSMWHLSSVPYEVYKEKSKLNENI